MILLTTGHPTATVEGDQIKVEIPSGKTTVTVALSYAQARHMAETTIRLVNEAITAANRDLPESELIAFPREVASLARRERRIAEILRASHTLASN